jgi:CPA2 family monovalent cation:H+ antiporter-2
MPFVILEINYSRVEQIKSLGFPVIYGDASQSIILEAAEIDKAKLLLITTPVTIVSQAIVSHVKKLNPDLQIVARAEAVEHMKALYDHGVYNVVQPEFEAGLEFTRQALLSLDIPAERIQQFTDEVRQELYRPLYNLNTGYKTLEQLQHARDLFELIWITLGPDSPIVGKTIVENSRIRSRNGVTVVGVMRKGTLYSNPNPDFSFNPDDIVGVIGRTEELTAFRELAKL